MSHPQQVEMGEQRQMVGEEVLLLLEEGEEVLLPLLVEGELHRHLCPCLRP